MIQHDLSVVLCGEAGQGIKTIELFLTRILKFAGYNVFATKEYMSRIRGGANSTQIRISSNRVTCFVDRIDLLIVLNKGTARRQRNRISSQTIVLGEEEVLHELEGEVENLKEVAFSEIAKEAGNKLYANTVASGVVCGLLSVEKDIMDNFISKQFASKDEKVVRENLDAGDKGYDVGQKLASEEGIKIDIQGNSSVKDELLLSGVESVSLGAMAGGCNFITAYPMSPSTGVLVFLAGQSEEFGILAEQAEDEIAAVNMALGAWYAGARALVTTSGGGFALMEEGISLSGVLELPLVIHLGQRPGPGTGLPTRTEQGDLELALYAGHGEFPRIILAPGSLEQAFLLTQKAFNLADQFQIPVFILTDQYFLDSYYNIPDLDLEKSEVKKHIVQTNSDYKRYQLTKDGVSPRGTPGHGQGLVRADSDEHDEAGFITEDFDTRTKMVQKRLKKMDQIQKEVIEPELVGDKDYKHLVVGWGSTYHVIREALIEMKNSDASFLHFSQVYPLPSKTGEYLDRAEKVVMIENNATSQFSRLIKLQAGFDIEHKILKYNGLPFSREEIIEKLGDLLS